MDLTSVTVVMQAHTAAMSAAKGLGDSSLQKQLADALVEAAKVIQENAELRVETTELKAQLAVREDLVWDPQINAYRKNAEPNVVYCPKCFGKEGRANRMRDRGHDWRCYVCEAVAQRPEPPAGPARRYPIADDYGPTEPGI